MVAADHDLEQVLADVTRLWSLPADVRGSIPETLKSSPRYHDLVRSWNDPAAIRQLLLGQADPSESSAWEVSVFRHAWERANASDAFAPPQLALTSGTIPYWEGTNLTQRYPAVPVAAQESESKPTNVLATAGINGGGILLLGFLAWAFTRGR